jgi:branched-chain amino acid transport system substrate-binding protein
MAYQKEGVSKMRKWFYVLLAVFILAAAIPLAGCGGEKEASGEPYKIGAVFSNTGFNAPLGQPEVQTVEMMEQQINKKGGINGHPVDIIWYDTASVPATCYDMAKKLINDDKVVAIIGPTGTGDTNAIIDLVRDSGVPLISCAAGTTLTVPTATNDKHWLFQSPQTTLMIVDRLFDYLETQDITKIALITDTAGFGVDGLKTITAEAAPDKYNLTITESQTYGTNDSDMSTQLGKIRDSNPQAVICWGTNPGPAVIATNMSALGMRDIPLFCSHGIAFKAFIDLAGDDANGVIFPCGKLPIVDSLPHSAQKDLLLEYRKNFEAKYGKGETNTFGGHAYDALSMVVAALDKAVTETPEEISGSNDTLQAVRAKIRDYVEQKVNSTGYPDTDGFVATAGIFNISASDHNGLSKDCIVMVKIADGKWTPAE